MMCRAGHLTCRAIRGRKVVSQRQGNELCVFFNYAPAASAQER
jgi:hypothetical protein